MLLVIWTFLTTGAYLSFSSLNMLTHFRTYKLGEERRSQISQLIVQFAHLRSPHALWETTAM